MGNIFDLENEMVSIQPEIDELVANFKRPHWVEKAHALQKYSGKKVKLTYFDHAKSRPCEASYVIGVFRGMVTEAVDGDSGKAGKFWISLQGAQCYSATGSKIMGQEILQTHIDNFSMADLA